MQTLSKLLWILLMGLCLNSPAQHLKSGLYRDQSEKMQLTLTVIGESVRGALVSQGESMLQGKLSGRVAQKNVIVGDWSAIVFPAKSDLKGRFILSAQYSNGKIRVSLYLEESEDTGTTWQLEKVSGGACVNQVSPGESDPE